MKPQDIRLQILSIAFVCTRTYHDCMEYKTILVCSQHNIPKLCSGSTKQDWQLMKERKLEMLNLIRQK